eukprot:TRINITY_DN798_c0_g4_i1.p1 TRINITY_DN798_c0_g4~~TRINITY_DN798_c0_g4_i1.p1  ORF type:complete len:308 (+),score=16.10 TRINITY_DN798_c0_g4_i1:208-1131(+)
MGDTDGSEFIAGLWHNDRAGNRLKLFVRLHDVDPDPSKGGHPTLVARGSHALLPFSIEDYSHSRLKDEFVRAEYPVSYLGGKMGSGFIFDTNSLHRGFPGGRLSRTTIVLEYHRAIKCPIIMSLRLPIPCPSGDQRLIDVAGDECNEGKCTARRATECATASGQSCSAALGESNTCIQQQEAVKESGPASSYTHAFDCVRWIPLREAFDELPDGFSLIHPPYPNNHSAIGSVAGKPGFMLVEAGSSLQGVTVAALAEVCSSRWRQYTYDVIPLDANTYWHRDATAWRSVSINKHRLGYSPFTGEKAR